MRGKRVSAQSKKVDLVVVSARYTPEGWVHLVQAYQRYGAVWSDLVLLTREELLTRLQAGARVATGRTLSLPGDYQIEDVIRWKRLNGIERLALQGQASDPEGLGVPLF